MGTRKTRRVRENSLIYTKAQIDTGRKKNFLKVRLGRTHNGKEEKGILVSVLELALIPLDAHILKHYDF